MMTGNSRSPRRVLNIFVLAMFNVSVMASLRNLPLVAEFGLGALFFFVTVAILFLIPSALVSAELSTGWPKAGGVYIWVKEAFGEKWGFFAIWMQWVHNVAWYPVILSFVATTLAYVIDPALVNNKTYVIAVILVGFWGMTLINFLGIKTSSWFSTFGVIGGTILPGLLIIGLGMSWLMSGNPSATHLTAQALLPDLSRIENFVFLGGFFLAFSGLEVSSAYANTIQNPQKNIPRAIILAASITFFVFMLGSLAIAVVIPKHEISLVAGLMEAFKAFFNHYNLAWLVPPLAILLIIGAIAEINAWIIGPVKGLHTTSTHGNLPPLFQKLNAHGTPTNLLLLQAIIVTISSVAFIYMPSISSSYWILTALSAQSYLIMYVVMFAAAIRLRYSQPKVPRPYRVPTLKGMWIASIAGMLASLFAIIVAFFPPSQLDVGNLWFYESFLFIGLIFMCSFPLIVHKYRKPKWITIKEETT